MNRFSKNCFRTGYRCILMMVCTATPLSAATVNWGSPYYSDLVTTTGLTIGSNFTFELGFFEDDFVPTNENVSSWVDHWRVFDVAEYDESTGYFTGTADLRADGSSSSFEADVGVNFSGKEAYVWVYNAKTATTESEWFLARSASWVLPSAPEEDCCDDTLPVQWSIDDLATGETPVFGAHGDAAGAGVAAQPQSNNTIQTYAVPEPNALGLLLVSVILWLRRRVKEDSRAS